MANKKSLVVFFLSLIFSVEGFSQNKKTSIELLNTSLAGRGGGGASGGGGCWVETINGKQEPCDSYIKARWTPYNIESEVEHELYRLKRLANIADVGFGENFWECEIFGVSQTQKCERPIEYRIVKELPAKIFMELKDLEKIKRIEVYGFTPYGENQNLTYLSPKFLNENDPSGPTLAPNKALYLVHERIRAWKAPADEYVAWYVEGLGKLAALERGEIGYDQEMQDALRNMVTAYRMITNQARMSRTISYLKANPLNDNQCVVYSENEISSDALEVFFVNPIVKLFEEENKESVDMSSAKLCTGIVRLPRLAVIDGIDNKVYVSDPKKVGVVNSNLENCRIIIQGSRNALDLRRACEGERGLKPGSDFDQAIIGNDNQVNNSTLFSIIGNSNIVINSKLFYNFSNVNAAERFSIRGGNNQVMDSLIGLIDGYSNTVKDSRALYKGVVGDQNLLEQSRLNKVNSGFPSFHPRPAILGSKNSLNQVFAEDVEIVGSLNTVENVRMQQHVNSHFIDERIGHLYVVGSENFIKQIDLDTKRTVYINTGDRNRIENIQGNFEFIIRNMNGVVIENKIENKSKKLTVIKRGK